MANIDIKLLDQCRTGNSLAQHKLYKYSYSTMKGACLRYLRNDQDISDAINRSFLKVINHLDSFDRSRSYDAWLRRIVINTILDQLRKEKRRIRARDLDEVMELNVDSAQWSEMNEADLNYDAEELMSMLKTLPEKTGIVFNMFAIDGYSHKEISQSLDMSVGNSKWHVHKARDILQKMILSKENRITQ